jgi:Ca2+-transporting ATPase
MSEHETLLLGLSLLAAALPIGFPIVAHLLLRQTGKRLLASEATAAGKLSFHEPAASAKSLIKAARRTYFTAAVAELTVVITSFITAVVWQLAPAINAQQILTIDLLVLVAPVVALGWDHNLSSPRQQPTMVKFGLLVGALAYVNYWLFFARHSLSSANLDLNLPLYKQATALVFVTLSLCLLVHLMFVRSHHHKHFFTAYLWQNRKLLGASGLSLMLIVFMVYSPWLQSLLRTESLSAMDWLTAVGFGLLYAAARLLQRHTRKHNRRAVIKLHRAVRPTKA